MELLSLLLRAVNTLASESLPSFSVALFCFKKAISVLGITGFMPVFSFAIMPAIRFVVLLIKVAFLIKSE